MVGVCLHLVGVGAQKLCLLGVLGSNGKYSRRGSRGGRRNWGRICLVRSGLLLFETGVLWAGTGVCSEKFYGVPFGLPCGIVGLVHNGASVCFESEILLHKPLVTGE